MTFLIDFFIISVLIFGIALFREPLKARFGNWTAAFALLCALGLVLYRNGIIDVGTVLIALLVGAVLGHAVARAASMIQIPSIVAFQHGAGGVAAFLVSFVELTRGDHALSLVNEISGVLGLTIGALTFSGSMIASAKLANKMRQAPQILPAHTLLLLSNAALLAMVGSASFFVSSQAATFLFVAQILLAASFGILFSIRIGGADMPVLISFLNATAGFAAALCGMVIENQLLIAFGATVAASGSILTHVMCKAMNRTIAHIFLPNLKKQPLSAPKTTDSAEPAFSLKAKSSGNENDLKRAAAILKEAQKVVFVPGYGMALAKAQQEVAALATRLMGMGIEVKYAIHPVAGRMPGHMNVLLAEAGIDYDMLVEMDEINPHFHFTDAAVIVGACDVVNPSANETEGTPISGMPILMAQNAKNIICCNFDKKPGYSGVENSLYGRENTIMLLGDANKTIRDLSRCLNNGKPETTGETKSSGDITLEAATALACAKKVIIIPGYGMALAKAQFTIAELAALLTEMGVEVKYAIHPVAGRMPGHMNVILAEAEVEYDDLLELEEVNPLFGETDVALVIGACDVVNPAAMQMEGTPISGMPILLAHEAKKIIVCNLDEKPGYSGVGNPLYANPNTIMMLGDAKASANALISSLSRSVGITHHATHGQERTGL
ncbi:MAG: NAD(P)(+) transhydrogenase (Re/Si-specific) subunit beta [Desulfobacterales bacterium]|nr:NAD(P)(+) transhydrogenase (Re/Si-specific) subunit beta [Desulfobacterales bacterium]